MLIAVASRDGKEIDQHFGQAERFLIYEVEGESVNLVDERKVERYCSTEPDHPLRGELLRKIADDLTGCRAIACARIGEAPLMEMERLGMDVFTVEGPIRSALVELAKVL